MFLNPSSPLALRSPTIALTTLAAILSAQAAPSAPSGTSGLQCSQVRTGQVVQVPVGKSVIVRPETPVVRIVLGNPDNASAVRPSEGAAETKGSPAPAAASARRPGVGDVDVLLLGPGELYLLGKSLGTTNVVTVDRRGVCTAYDVVVGMDTTALQTLLRQVLPDETDVQATTAFDSVVLTGTASDSEAITRITDLANAFVRGQQGSGSTAGAAGNPRIVNLLGVGAPQQVMLEVKVAEVSKSLIDKLGVQLGASRTNGNWTYALLADFLSGGNAAVSAIKAASGLSIKLDAQKTDGLVKVLAEPNVMAISGQTGSFLAGGKIFIPVAQTNSNGSREVTLEEKEFGVSVKFTPTVLGNGRINLRVRPEVSELNREGIGIVAAGVSGSAILPSFTSRKAETTVQLMDGQSFAIGGLIKNNTTTSIKALPFLGELPVIGALFRSTEFQNDRSELVFVITPRLVKPLPPEYRLPTDNIATPTRSELHWKGRAEGQPADSGSDAPTSMEKQP
jgi:pilus assembly protein CpaC